MRSTEAVKTMVQCDFDGTITERDVSFLLLDHFADGNWRPMLTEYQEGKMSVGAFNTRAFAMVRADKQTLLDFVFTSGEVKIRPGFQELVSYCSQNGLKFVIVSNGQDFYIEAILREMGLTGIEFHAAQSRFQPRGMDVQYIGPDGSIVEANFKDTYTELFLSQGYRVIYVGNGISDIYPARQAYHTFATSDLLERCKETKLDCTPFHDLNDVVRGLELLRL